MNDGMLAKSTPVRVNGAGSKYYLTDEGRGLMILLNEISG
jgi:hypothetical protein